VDTVARLIEETPGYHAGMPTISPDGRWLAFVANDGADDEYRVFVRPFPRADGQRIPVSLEGGSSSPEWSRDGSELFYVNRSGEVMAARLSTGTPTRITRRPLFTLGPEVRRGALVTSMQIRSDGRFLMNRDDPNVGPDMVIVVNWLEELKARSNN